jgi:hypothetical protein
VKAHLPVSPRKRKAVISKLAKDLPTQDETKTSGNKALPESVQKCVEAFFCLDTISRQAPGRKDYVSMKQHDKKIKVQKRHLIWTLNETYTLFQKQEKIIQFR